MEVLARRIGGVWLRIVAIAAHKGGVGKTVTALGLAAAWARMGSRVLLVDLDPQAHASLGLGFEVEPERSMAAVFSDPPTALLEISAPAPEVQAEALLVAPSHIRLERAAQWLISRPRRDQYLGRALAMAGPAELVVLDCPPSLGPLVENALAASDEVIIPCQMEARAADGLVDLLELLALVRGDEFARWAILLTRVDSRKRVTNAATLAALSPWSDRILKTRIPVCEALNQAQIARRDIFAFDRGCSGALAYRTLAWELTQRWVRRSGTG